MKSELIPLDGGPPIPITRELTLIGRREYCDVAIDHPSLSRRHCIVVRTDGLLVIRDLITTNGTKVNGQRVMWAALLPDDQVTLGRMKYRVYLGPDHAPSPSEMVDQSPLAASQVATRTPDRPPVQIAGWQDVDQDFAAPSSPDEIVPPAQSG